MAEKITTLNPQMLQWARLQSGYDITNVEKKLNKQDILKKWECGEDYPTYAQLKTLFELYKKPVVICFFPEPPKMKNISTSFRTLPTSIRFSPNTIRLLNTAKTMQLNLYELNEDQNPNISAVNNLKSNFQQSNPSIYSEIRKLLNVSLEEQKKGRKISDKFEMWRDAFYHIGIYIFKDAFKDDSISGFCLYDDVFPVIYVNNSMSFTRQIFTLFHELCHILYQTSGLDFLKDDFIDIHENKTNADIEQRCNSFAGEFLVPTSEFCKHVGNRGYSDAITEKLANLFGVSRETVLRKYLDLGKIDNNLYFQKQEEFNEDYFRNREFTKSSGGGNWYNTHLSYIGENYLNLSYRNYYQHKITINQLADYLNMKISAVKKLPRARDG
ncbi:hypothetical protein SDC9_71856 [bioreactor metagenome]|uniref:IrrE N-terminal-like domain-containing protein n=1 Tax=bioreactor metagenome TaxID=1076179 RepID=A0A644Y9Z6_9ZZZZ